MDAMKSTQDEIALQGIEFWSNVCDEEYELQLLQQEVVRISSTFYCKYISSQCRRKNRAVSPNEQAGTMLVVPCPTWCLSFSND